MTNAFGQPHEIDVLQVVLVGGIGRRHLLVEARVEDVYTEPSHDREIARLDASLGRREIGMRRSGATGRVLTP
jgi:hypothetical protein